MDEPVKHDFAEFLPCFHVVGTIVDHLLVERGRARGIALPEFSERLDQLLVMSVEHRHVPACTREILILRNTFPVVNSPVERRREAIIAERERRVLVHRRAERLYGEIEVSFTIEALTFEIMSQRI